METSYAAEEEGGGLNHLWNRFSVSLDCIAVEVGLLTDGSAVVASAFGLYYRNLEEKAKDPIWNSPTANFFWLGLLINGRWPASNLLTGWPSQLLEWRVAVCHT